MCVCGGGEGEEEGGGAVGGGFFLQIQTFPSRFRSHACLPPISIS